MLRSFRARLVAGFAVVIVLTLVLAASAFVLLLREQQADAARQRIGTLVGPLTEGTRNMEALGWPAPAMRAQLTNVARYYDIRILLLDSGSHVVIDTNSAQSMVGDVLSLTQAEPVQAGGRIQTFQTQRINSHGDDLYLFTAGPPA